MGYYTAFKLTVHDDDKYADIEIIEDLRKTCEYADYAISEDGGVNEPCKWYDHEDDMEKFSKKYPDVLFELHGEGEESGDIWTKYFKNGKIQTARARIEIDGFDPEKLV